MGKCYNYFNFEFFACYYISIMIYQLAYIVIHTSMSYIPTQYIIVVSSQLYVVWIETPLALYKHHKHFFLNSTNHISNLPIEQNMGQFFICINICTVMSWACLAMGIFKLIFISNSRNFLVIGGTYLYR